jgi:AraC-like DNA-binding protein
MPDDNNQPHELTFLKQETHQVKDAIAQHGTMTMLLGSTRRFHLNPHCHHHYELIYLLDGQQNLRTEALGCCLAERGDLLIFRPGEIHEEWYESGPLSLIALRFRDADLERFGLHFPASCAGLIRLPHANRFRDLLQRMHDEVWQPGINSTLLHSAYMVEFMVLLQRSLAELEAIGAQDPEARVLEVVAQIRNNPVEVDQVSSLARIADMSQRSFSAHFKAVTGSSPQDFIIGERIELAKRLLRESTVSAQEIAAQLGYDDPYFFYRQFKDRTGMTAGQYRQQTTP